MTNHEQNPERPDKGLQETLGGVLDLQRALNVANNPSSSEVDRSFAGVVLTAKDEYPQTSLENIFGEVDESDPHSAHKQTARYEVLRSIVDGARNLSEVQTQTPLEKGHTNKAVAELEDAGVISVGEKWNKLVLDSSLATRPPELVTTTSALRKDVIAVTHRLASEGKLEVSRDELVQEVLRQNPHYEGRENEIWKTMKEKIRTLAWTGISFDPSSTEKEVSINPEHEGFLQKLTEGVKELLSGGETKTTYFSNRAHSLVGDPAFLEKLGHEKRKPGRGTGKKMGGVAVGDTITPGLSVKDVKRRLGVSMERNAKAQGSLSWAKNLLEEALQTLPPGVEGNSSFHAVIQAINNVTKQVGNASDSIREYRDKRL